MSDTIDNTIDIGEIRERLRNQKGKAFWRSLDELADTQEFQDFLHEEFPRQAAPLEGSFQRKLQRCCQLRAIRRKDQLEYPAAKLRTVHTLPWRGK